MQAVRPIEAKAPEDEADDAGKSVAQAARRFFFSAANWLKMQMGARWHKHAFGAPSHELKDTVALAVL